MKKLVLLIALIAAAPVPAQADNCAQQAQRVAAQMGAQVLSAKAEGGSCVVTLRVPGKGGQPPRVETMVLGG